MCAKSPNTIRLVLTGQSDLSSAVRAVNEGSIIRFLMKPCDKSVLMEAITLNVALHNQRGEERVDELPVHLCRSTTGLKLQSVHTVDISNSGVRLGRPTPRPTTTSAMPCEPWTGPRKPKRVAKRH